MGAVRKAAEGRGETSLAVPTLSAGLRPCHQFTLASALISNYDGIEHLKILRNQMHPVRMFREIFIVVCAEIGRWRLTKRFTIGSCEVLVAQTMQRSSYAGDRLATCCNKSNPFQLWYFHSSDNDNIERHRNEKLRSRISRCFSAFYPAMEWPNIAVCCLKRLLTWLLFQSDAVVVVLCGLLLKHVVPDVALSENTIGVKVVSHV